MCDKKILRSIHFLKSTWLTAAECATFLCKVQLLDETLIFVGPHSLKRKENTLIHLVKRKIKHRTLLTMFILILEEQHCITYTPKRLRYWEIQHLTEAERGFFRRSQLLKRTFGIFGTEYGKCSETICRWCFYIHGHHTLSLEHF